MTAQPRYLLHVFLLLLISAHSALCVDHVLTHPLAATAAAATATTTAAAGT
jgi:hypothetical protein